MPPRKKRGKFRRNVSPSLRCNINFMQRKITIKASMRPPPASLKLGFKVFLIFSLVCTFIMFPQVVIFSGSKFLFQTDFLAFKRQKVEWNFFIFRSHLKNETNFARGRVSCKQKRLFLSFSLYPID